MRLAVLAVAGMVAMGFGTDLISEHSIQVNPVAQGHNLDFEAGLQGWTKTGSAFDSQPVKGDSLTTDRIGVVKLGGNYWSDLPYPVGHHGDYWIGTCENQSTPCDAPVGTLTSEEIPLTGEIRYISFLIGGSSDLEHEQLELHIRGNSSSDGGDMERRFREWAAASPPKGLAGSALAGGKPIHDGDYLVVMRATGEKLLPRRGIPQIPDLLRQRVYEIPDFLRGHAARLKIVDDSGSGHINVDHIQFTTAPPGPHIGRVWGFGDYHTHPMTHIAFGGLKGVRTVWGVPGEDGVLTAVRS